MIVTEAFVLWQNYGSPLHPGSDTDCFTDHSKFGSQKSEKLGGDCLGLVIPLKVNSFRYFVYDILTCLEFILFFSWEFFRLAQAAYQRTVSPTIYNINWDRNALDADKMQTLASKFGHLYNCSGVVALSAVLQYAHELAFRTGTSLGREGDEGIRHHVYYL